MLNSLANPVVSNRIGSYWPLVVFVLYVVYMATALTLPFVGKLSAGCLLLVGWLGLYGAKGGFYAFTRAEKFLIVSFVLFTLISIISFFYWPHTRLAQMHLEDYGTFMLLVPLYVLLRQFQFNFTGIVVLLASMALLLGVVSTVQYVAMHYYHVQIFTSDNVFSKMWGRPSGGVNPMRYAAISLVLSTIALNGVLLIKCKATLRVLLCVSAFMGLMACYLTETRGTFLAVPVLAFMYGVYLYKSGHPKFLMVLLVVSALLVAGLSQNDRVKATVASFEGYQQGNSVTSLGARFDMFKAAIILIEEKPIWGRGLGGYLEGGKEVRKVYPDIEWHVGNWSNPHNEILLVMVEKGFIGLITLLMLFAAPAYLFFRALRRADDSSAGQQTKFYAMSGLSLLVVYAVVGQSVALFQHDVFNHFFCLMVLLLVSQVRVIEYVEGRVEQG